MLVRITNSCTMNCSHCMIDANPNGEHMTRDIFLNAILFSIRYDPSMLFISGGEPTDHPDFIEYIQIAKLYQRRYNIPYILVASNGLFLENESYAEEVLNLGVHFQITNDSRYYPQKIRKIEHPYLLYEDTLRQIAPIGRAVINNLEIPPQSPMCFNLRSSCIHFQDFFRAIYQLRTLPNPKFCSPSINVDGTISMGESNACYKIGTINSTGEKIIANINAMKCGKCGLHKHLSGIHLEKWESWENK
jgi:hypothetical protein